LAISFANAGSNPSMAHTERRAPSRKKGEQALLNYALDLAQEWGAHWLKPVQERLRKAYPEMTQEELDRLNSIAQAAMKAGHELVYSMAEQREKGKDPQQSVWQEAYLKEFPWVDRDNLGHLFSTGMYYAWRDGLV
jgi:hypothetical protein